jgi:hypothetical protein
VTQINSQPANPAPIRPEFREHLLNAFRDDIGLLSDLIRRDLSHWMN